MTYRIAQFLNLLQDLRQCAAEVRSEMKSITGKKRRLPPGPHSTPSVNLGRTVDRAPLGSVYPFQVSNMWRIQKFREALHLVEKPVNPVGFGENQQDLQGRHGEDS